jgi:hypothetical protein
LSLPSIGEIERELSLSLAQDVIHGYTSDPPHDHTFRTRQSEHRKLPVIVTENPLAPEQCRLSVDCSKCRIGTGLVFADTDVVRSSASRRFTEETVKTFWGQYSVGALMWREVRAQNHP